MVNQTKRGMLYPVATIASVTTLMLASSGPAARGRGDGSPFKDRDRVSRALRANQQALQTYRWTQRRITTVNGKVQNDAMFTILPEGGGTFRRVQISAREEHFANRKQQSDARDYRDEMEKLIAAYAQELQPDKLAKFIDHADATAGSGESSGTWVLHGANVVRRGDSVTLYVSGSTYQPKSMEVHTSQGKDFVSGTVTFTALDGGTWCPLTALVQAPQKDWQMTIQNSEFARGAVAE